MKGINQLINVKQANAIPVLRIIHPMQKLNKYENNS
jgi:hypothetical protein